MKPLLDAALPPYDKDGLYEILLSANLYEQHGPVHALIFKAF